MVSLSPLCVFEEQARMKCKTGQRSSTRRIMVIAKPRYQGPTVVRVSVCKLVNVCTSVCLCICIRGNVWMRPCVGVHVCSLHQGLSWYLIL